MLAKVSTALALASTLCLPWLSCSTAQAAPTLLPAASEYTARPACATPGPGHAGCLALLLAPKPSSAAPAAGVLVERVRRQASAASPAVARPVLPAELHTAYDLPDDAAEPQTIALVDAYDDPNIEADLANYDARFGLPECTHANGCFTKVNERGESTHLPNPNGEWSVEISADVEVAHSVCENCRIVLVEAESDVYAHLETAENVAAAEIQTLSRAGALEGAISNSWGGPEPGPDSAAFDHPGLPITAAAGDNGYLNWQLYGKSEEEGYFAGADYPAASPDVIAVGGTSLKVGSHGEWLSEEVWNDRNGAGGSGCSAAFRAQPWQLQANGWAAVGCGSARSVADVAADADPVTGVAVYDSVPEGLGTKKERPGEEPPGLIQVGGTSVASPIIASAFALAGGAHGIAYPAATLYANAASQGAGTVLHDIAVGGDGACDDRYATCSGASNSPLDCGAALTICNAATGYDGPTGVGTPIGLGAFQPLPGELGGPGGSGAGNSGGPGGAGGSGSGVAAPGASSPPASTPSSTAPVPPPPARVTHLSLTLGSVIALNRHRPRASQLAFVFSLSAAARVRISLSQWLRVHGHWQWVTLPGSFTVAASGGVNRERLGTQRRLDAGRYRLTLVPSAGVADSLPLVIG